MESQIDNYDLEWNVSYQGWKLLYHDIFRPPSYSALLSLLIGIGAQITAAALIYLTFMVSFGRHIDLSAKFVLGFLSYSIAAFIGGYTAAGLYKRWNGFNWLKHLTATAGIVPIAVVIVQFVLNLVAIAYGSNQAARLSSWISLVIWYVVIVIPATFLGGIVGRHWFFIGPNPTAIGIIPRTIPPMPLYLTMPYLCIMVSIIAIGSIAAEVKYILSALWQHRMGHVWGVSLVAFVLLLLVIALSVIIAVYVRLSKENYKWQWLSFLAPFSIVVPIELECIQYFRVQTEMVGLMQTLYYFAYTSVLSCVIGTVCGFAGFASTAFFVRRIYRTIKVD
jgi:hypothetical protein